MTERRAVVVIGGVLKELPDGDTLKGAGLGGSSIENFDGGEPDSIPVVGLIIDGGTP